MKRKCANGVSARVESYPKSYSMTAERSKL